MCKFIKKTISPTAPSTSISSPLWTPCHGIALPRCLLYGHSLEQTSTFSRDTAATSDRSSHLETALVVANNFSSVKGWQDYSSDADRESMTRTWPNLRLMIKASGGGNRTLLVVKLLPWCHGARRRIVRFSRTHNKNARI